ncbi:YqjD family protein [Klebsiella sp. NPDC088457]
MTDKFEDKIDEVAGAAQQKYGELTDDYGHQAKGAARKLSAQGGQAVQDAAEVVREQVTDNPVKAVAVAAGFGLLIGLLIGRK